jgi:hypothetical protein
MMSVCSTLWLALSPALRQDCGPFFVESRYAMGKLDRRHSLKMNRRKAQAKKKLRDKRPKVRPAAEGEAAPKKARSAKAAPATDPAG